MLILAQGEPPPVWAISLLLYLAFGPLLTFVASIFALGLVFLGQIKSPCTRFVTFGSFLFSTINVFGAGYWLFHPSPNSSFPLGFLWMAMVGISFVFASVASAHVAKAYFPSDWPDS